MRSTSSGHGAMFDFSESPDLAKLVAEFYEAGKLCLPSAMDPAGYSMFG